MSSPLCPINEFCEVFDFSPENLFRAFCNHRCPESQVAAHSSVGYLARYLDSLGAKTIVVEHGYIDRDYLDDYAAYYAKCFHQYDRFCKRLHFFSKSFSFRELESVLQGADDRDFEGHLKKSYLGFSIARPLPDAIVGRTILITYGPDGGRRSYPCTLKYEANLFGLQLEIQSLAFQEQDTVLAACATVALWCAFQKTRSLFGSQAPTPAAITRAGTLAVNRARPFPSHGLSLEQMCSAVRQAGLEPEVIGINEEVPLPSLIYAYLKLGIPIILGVTIEGMDAGHAITITGYSIDKTRRSFPEVANPKTYIPMVGLRIDQLYAHDDQIGPFSKLRVMPSKTTVGGDMTFPVTLEGTWNKDGRDLTLYPHMAMIPVYSKIRLNFLEVQKLIFRISSMLSIFFAVLKPEVKPEQDFEWDIHVTTTNDYKTTLKTIPGFPREDLKRLVFRQHPKFIWKTTLRVKGTTLLEMLLDATDMARSQPIYEAIWFDPNLRDQINKLLRHDALRSIIIPRISESLLDFLVKSSSIA